MNKILLTTLSIVALSVLFTVQAQDGFVVWGKGGGCDRELTFNKIEGGKLGAEKVAVTKGVGADIHVHISYDGVWIAFSRATKTWKTSMGGCDYHTSDNFDMYIAKIDNGNNLPAKPIKVDHGFWSSWGEDAKDPDKPKTLYYQVYKSGSYMKTVIQPDGSHSTPVKIAGGVGKAIFHSQTSPDGKYVAYRPKGIKVMDVSTGKNVPGAGGSGCHPSWGPRSKYLIWAQNTVCRIDGGVGKGFGKVVGLGKYWYGISNDAFYDEGKLWIIGKMGGGEQNAAGPIEFKEVDISGSGWKPAKTGTKVGNGATCDIHIYDGKGSTKSKVNKIDKRASFDALVTTSDAGLQLIISSQKLTGNFAELFNLQGKRVAFKTLSGTQQNVISLNSITDGNYILKISNDKVSTQKTIWISR